jgi:hypothetical protein
MTPVIAQEFFFCPWMFLRKRSSRDAFIH